jgi:hypothetical protein
VSLMSCTFKSNWGRFGGKSPKVGSQNMGKNSWYRGGICCSRGSLGVAEFALTLWSFSSCRIVGYHECSVVCREVAGPSTLPSFQSILGLKSRSYG